MQAYRFVHEDKRSSIGASVGVVPIDRRWSSHTELMQAAVVNNVLSWMQSRDLSACALVAINLSGQSIGDRSFHEFARDRVLSSPIDHSKLCFEITETAAITRIADAQEFARAVRALGVKIALDDFGAGASSFGYLENLPYAQGFLFHRPQSIDDLL